jgi:hypothetical protein
MKGFLPELTWPQPKKKVKTNTKQATTIPVVMHGDATVESTIPVTRSHDVLPIKDNVRAFLILIS